MSLRRLKILLWLLCMWVVLRNAWLCEDAFITFRVVDNVVHGFGLRWNPLERVQVYTHPLWMLSLVPLHFVTRDILFSAHALGILCTGITLVLLLRAQRTLGHVLVASLVVLSSKAFMDYATGGLENPLSHVWIVLFLRTYLERSRDAGRFPRMVLWTSMAMVTRMDSVWFCLAPLLHEAWVARAWRPRRLRLWLGLLPLAAWCGFAFLYYGFVFPSSAYAKLGVHVSAWPMIVQGFCYLSNSLAWDPVTLFAIVAMTAFGLSRVRVDRQLAVVACGVLLYLAYMIRVGGDYMSGRFLTEALVVALVLLSRVEWRVWGEWAVPAAIVAVLGFASPRPPILTTDDYKGLGSSPLGIDDEKGYRFGDTALLRQNRHTSLADVGGWVGDGRAAREQHADVRVYRNIGFFGYYAGPGVHVIDPYGIGDALMGRLPFYEGSRRWDSGHFMRDIPEGYPEAAVGRGPIADPKINAYFEKLRVVTRAPLFDGERLRLMVRFALGQEPPPS